MKKLSVVAAAILLLSACGKQEPPPPPPTSGGAATPAARPEKLPNGQPAVVTVKHVLISFEGAMRSKQKRTKLDAQKLAYDIVGRAKSGEDFDKLMKEFSDDPGEGTYTQVNHGVAPQGSEFTREDGPQPFVKAFGDVAFIINIGEIGLAEYDEQASPFGWHVIKRIK